MASIPSSETEDAWCASERAKVVAYLEAEGVSHLGVGDWPAFHVSPYLAIWAVQSKTSLGVIGWWAVSGDTPTDYLSGSGISHPREAMARFGDIWADLSDRISRGDDPGNIKIGTRGDWPVLAPLLRSRSELLKKYAEDSQIWE